MWQCVNLTEEEAAQSHESDDAFGAQECGENQISHNSGDISNGREDTGARFPANEEDSFPSWPDIFISRGAAYPRFSR